MAASSFYKNTLANSPWNALPGLPAECAEEADWFMAIANERGRWAKRGEEAAQSGRETKS